MFLVNISHLHSVQKTLKPPRSIQHPHLDTGEDILASLVMSLDTKNKSLGAIYWQQINLELLEIIDFSFQTLMGMLLSLSSWAVGRVMSCPEILAIW